MRIRRHRRIVPRGLGLLVLGLAALPHPDGTALAQQDYDNWKHMDVPAAPALSAEEQKQTFRIAPGFAVELVAAEPEIVDPVAIRWDAAGRLWAVEMRGYMPNVRGEGEQKPVGQVAVLEDRDGDGYMETRTTFLDGLVMPRAVALVEGGVLVAEPPNLWYCRDTDGDLRCDEKTKVLEYARQGPVEHTANGLRRAIDNWFYNAKSELRFRFDLDEGGEPKLTLDRTRFRGQWGITQDSHGRLYYNHNSHYLMADTYRYEAESSEFPEHDELTQPHGAASDQAVHSIRVNPGINRGYQPHMLREDGRLKRTTAVSGQAIYRGLQFPDRFDEDAFVPEPAGNVLACFDMERRDGTIHAEHTLFDDPEWGKREFLASTDERFRPVDVENGPDGTLYVVDLYRGILQHKAYITEKYLKPQILARNLDKPVGLGRIWRIVSTEQSRPKRTPNLRQKSSNELVELLAHPNGWHRDWAQRLLIRRGDASVVPALRRLAVSGDRRLGRIHAIWTLGGMDKLNDRVIEASLNSRHRQVRIAAARASAPATDPPVDVAPTDYGTLDDGWLEAEAAQRIAGPDVASDHEGFTGEGYIDFQGARLDAIEWHLSNVPAGQYRLTFRYAMAGEPRPLKLTVNGEVVDPALTLATTGNWSEFGTQGVDIELEEGENVIRLKAIGHSGPNIDRLRLVPGR